ncbi:hypothetical protein XENTR_v10013390 [Xenopus tropicalis]|nr:hypothetical protein XENTR_v10013390 [Xenopus tropicalis]
MLYERAFCSIPKPDSLYSQKVYWRERLMFTLCRTSNWTPAVLRERQLFSRLLGLIKGERLRNYRCP